MRPVLAFMGSGGDTQTVTVGVTGAVDHRKCGYLSPSLGSIVDGTSNLYAGATILALLFDENNTLPLVKFTVNGIVANSGWSTMTVAGRTYPRSSASFTASGGQTTWQWDDDTNPFDFFAGAVVPVVFA